jgi:hypothetical protein
MKKENFITAENKMNELLAIAIQKEVLISLLFLKVNN